MLEFSEPAVKLMQYNVGHYTKIELCRNGLKKSEWMFIEASFDLKASNISETYSHVSPPTLQDSRSCVVSSPI